MKANASLPPQGACSDSFSAAPSAGDLVAGGVRAPRSSATPTPAAAEGVDAISLHVFSPADDVNLVTAPAAGHTVRIVLGLDIRTESLPQIRADWGLVASSVKAAPEYAEQLAALALHRLIARSVNVSGVAIAEPLIQTLEPWLRRVA